VNIIVKIGRAEYDQGWMGDCRTGDCMKRRVQMVTGLVRKMK
jgi:hypothetical protein